MGRFRKKAERWSFATTIALGGGQGPGWEGGAEMSESPLVRGDFMGVRRIQDTRGRTHDQGHQSVPLVIVYAQA